MSEFAKPEDVEARLLRALTDAEKAAATAVIAEVTGLITDVVDRDAAWAAALDPVPVALKGLCVSKAISVIANPQNLASESETLGVHSRSQTFPRSGDAGVLLTPLEERVVTRAVYGGGPASSSAESVVDRVVEMREGEEPE